MNLCANYHKLGRVSMRTFDLLNKDNGLRVGVTISVEDNSGINTMVTVVGCDKTFNISNGMDGFVGYLNSIGLDWSDVYSGLYPNQVPLTALRAEQLMADALGDEYESRLLVVSLK